MPNVFIIHQTIIQTLPNVFIIHQTIIQTLPMYSSIVIIKYHPNPGNVSSPINYHPNPGNVSSPINYHPNPANVFTIHQSIHPSPARCMYVCMYVFIIAHQVPIQSAAARYSFIHS
jgi:hypothetical protein